MFCKLKQVLKLILPLKIQKYIKKKILFLNLLRYNLEIKKRANMIFLSIVNYLRI